MAQSQGVPQMIHFDSSAVGKNDRFAFWLDEICRNYCRTDTQRLRGDDFLARLSRSALGCLEISNISCEPLRYERSADDLRRAPSDDFLLSLMVEGEGRLSQAGRDALQRPGGVVVYDTARPFSYEFPAPYRMYLLKVPRAALLARVPQADRLTAMVIGGDSALGELAGGMIRNAAALQLREDTPAAARIGMSIVDVIGAAMDVELGSHDQPVDRRTSLLKRAKDYIQCHLDDPDLDIDRIAAALFVSPSTLGRVFTADGTTVIRWLWGQRLAAGHRMLTEGRASLVTEVALSCGFSSFSHFSRAFKALYGVSPNTLMRPPNRPVLA